MEEKNPQIIPESDLAEGAADKENAGENEAALNEEFPAEQIDGYATESEEQIEPIPEYTPEGKYDATLYRVYRDKTLSEILRISSVVIVLATVYTFVFKLAELFSIGAYMHVARLAIITAIPFVIVTIARRIINAPRPYEIYPFYDAAPKNKKGSSFPSRHIFSVFVIAAALVAYAPVAAALLAVCGILLAVMRVLLGIHFIRDTVAGAILGIISGVIGLAVTYYIV